jgi:hypothetical protein
MKPALREQATSAIGEVELSSLRFEQWIVLTTFESLLLRRQGLKRQKHEWNTKKKLYRKI